MLKRRQIRETAIQYLYCADLEGGAAAENLEETFWQIAQESNIRKLALAKNKAIQHITQGRPGRIEKFVARQPEAQSLLGSYTDYAVFNGILVKLTEGESKLSTCLDRLSQLAKDEDEQAEFEEMLEEVFVLNHSLQNSRKEWHKQCEDFPELSGKLQACTAAIVQLGRISERLDIVEFPEKQPGHPATSHIESSSEELQGLRREAGKMIKGVLDNKETLDAKLSECIENFSPERIDPIDRAVMRLAVYELLNCPDVPRAVAINEAIEIARRFGSSQSARFINGVLDAVK
ncbi:transcription antitermination factor NusB [Persicirhabdus sediminis]|uniref:Transcription antitermination factor NusB n=1 Tax=Persicirhabdus sediminis TaxID=454144 RepID=A0A8J7MD59_9BACT|nr:transcription antitermination factor NusB [Persicirhabdus sediminis]MBK1790370.1 transcription antitermination factor NusB [Persicirhabdus sediminis]